MWGPEYHRTELVPVVFTHKQCLNTTYDTRLAQKTPWDIRDVSSGQERRTAQDMGNTSNISNIQYANWLNV